MNKQLRYSIRLADLLWISLAVLLAHWLRYRLIGAATIESKPPLFYAVSITVALIAWSVLYFNMNLDGFSRGWNFPAMSSQVIVAAVFLMGFLLAVGYLLKLNYSRLALSSLILLLPAGFITNRCVAWWLVKSRSRFGPTRRVVIVGSGRIAKELAKKIAQHPELKIEVAGFLYPSDATGSNESLKSNAGMVSVRTLDALELLQQNRIKELILAEQLPSGREIEKLITSCHRAGMQVRLVPQWYELYLSKARLTEIGDVPLVSVEARSLPPGAVQLKRAIDLALGSFLVVLALPLLAVISVVLNWKKGIAIKKELRCGRDGTQFWMYRFNVDRWASDLVGFEKFLALFSLTELPQLWNVIRGDMALVGPRPESPERVKHYSVWQRQRLSVKPGLTGLAQVYGLRERHTSEEKAHFDLQYIYHWSLFYDFSIFLQTAWTLTFRLLERKGSSDEPTQKPADRKRYGSQEVLHVDSPQPGAD
jgi:lipopolysaccharide/colanic/teichoic acid biosynthesis glycosyltransferase